MNDKSSHQFTLVRVPARNSFVVVAVVVIVMFLWAICFPLISVGLEDSPPLYYAGLRAIIAALCLLIPCWLLARPWPNGKQVWGLLIVVGLSITSAGFYGMFLAGGLVTPGLATVLANTQPLLAVIIAYFVLNERLGVRGIIGIFVGFLGIVLIGLGDTDNSGQSYTVGIIYISFASIGVAIGNVALKRLAGRVDVPTAMGWQLLIGSIPLLVLAGFTENSQSITWSLSFIIVLTTLSVIGTSVVFVLWFWLLKQNELGRINVYSFLTTGFGLLMGLWFFNESFGLIELAGILVTLVGIAIVGIKGEQK